MTTLNLSDPEKESVARIAVLAAAADGRLTAEELEKLSSLIAGLEPAARKRICQTIEAEKYSLEAEVRKLDNHLARREAFRSAVELCRSDGSVGVAEQAFLVRLTRRLSR